MSNIPRPATHLLQEYELQKALFESQPPIIQRFLESQAAKIASGLVERTNHIRFTLPDRLNLHMRQVGQEAIVTIPETQREQNVVNLLAVFLPDGLRGAILQRLRILEQNPDQAISAGASLLRYATATHLVSVLLPAGRSVTYRPDKEDAIPSIPEGDGAPESAITQASDAIAESDTPDEVGRGELQTPFVPAARRFYLPQWVAFDLDGRLLVGSGKEADARIQSMQNYVQVLHRASSLAPYMVACDEYQRKRYGILGQLINQGRALAHFKTGEIINEIKSRAKKGMLNRGLSVSMSYFDDQNLEIAETRFEIIPAGRIMFIPAFVVRASRGEQAKVSQDTRLSSSTRRHLLAQLKTLEMAFIA